MRDNDDSTVWHPVPATPGMGAPKGWPVANKESPLRTILSGYLEQVYQAQEEILRRIPLDRWPNRFEVDTEWNDERPRIIVKAVWDTEEVSHAVD